MSQRVICYNCSNNILLTERHISKTGKPCCEKCSEQCSTCTEWFFFAVTVSLNGITCCKSCANK